MAAQGSGKEQIRQRPAARAEAGVQLQSPAGKISSLDVPVEQTQAGNNLEPHSSFSAAGRVYETMAKTVVGGQLVGEVKRARSLGIASLFSFFFYFYILNKLLTTPGSQQAGLELDLFGLKFSYQDLQHWMPFVGAVYLIYLCLILSRIRGFLRQLAEHYHNAFARFCTRITQPLYPTMMSGDYLDKLPILLSLYVCGGLLLYSSWHRVVLPQHTELFNDLHVLVLYGDIFMILWLHVELWKLQTTLRFEDTPKKPSVLERVSAWLKSLK